MKKKKLERIERIKIRNDLEKNGFLIDRIIKWFTSSNLSKYKIKKKYKGVIKNAKKERKSIRCNFNRLSSTSKKIQIWTKGSKIKN